MLPRRVAATCPPVCTGFDKDGFDSTAATATRVVAYNIAEVDTDATFFGGGGRGKFWAQCCSKSWSVCSGLSKIIPQICVHYCHPRPYF